MAVEGQLAPVAARDVGRLVEGLRDVLRQARGQHAARHVHEEVLGQAGGRLAQLRELVGEQAAAGGLLAPVLRGRHAHDEAPEGRQLEVDLGQDVSGGRGGERDEGGDRQEER